MTTAKTRKSVYQILDKAQERTPADVTEEFSWRQKVRNSILHIMLLVGHICSPGDDHLNKDREDADLSSSF